MADLSSFSFTFPAAFSGLLLLLPVILLYLLRPKPKTISFPSTMFIRYIQKNKRFTSFLQRFVRDPILFMQIIIIAVVVSSLADPFYTQMQEKRDETSVVFVVDASASMQSTDVAPTRFQKAVEKVKELILDLNEDDDVSLVVAASTPATLMVRSKPELAYDSLSNIAVSDTPSSVGDAILLAKDMLGSSKKKKRIYVLSDFGPQSGIDPLMAKKIASLEGIDVNLLKLGVRGHNSAIVSLKAQRSANEDNQLFLTSSVRNYHPYAYEAELLLKANGQEIGRKKKVVEPFQEEFFQFTHEIGYDEQVLELNLAGEDDLPLDDTAYSHIPAAKTNKVMLLTSEEKDTYLIKMLQSLMEAKKLTLELGYPPAIPDLKQYDVVIVGDVSGSNILPGTFMDIRKYVESGATLIVQDSEDLYTLKSENLWAMMPVNLKGPSTRETEVKESDARHDILTDIVFDTVTVKKYDNAEVRDNYTIVLAESKASNSPLIAYKDLGSGYVAYMGIDADESRSNLYYSSSFPILYHHMIKYFTRKRASYSTKIMLTGEYMQFAQEPLITLPDLTQLKAKSLFLDKVGIYRLGFPDRTEVVPVNLLSYLESNTTGLSQDQLLDAGQYSQKVEEVEVTKELRKFILFVAVFFILLEILIYRRRGQL